LKEKVKEKTTRLMYFYNKPTILTANILKEKVKEKVKIILSIKN